MKTMKGKATQLSISVLISGMMLSSVHAQTLSQSPLEASIVVEPNIMLHLDDSLSMHNTVPEVGYDRGATYGNWVFDLSNVANAFQPNNIPYERIGRRGCNTNFIGARLNNTGSTRCLRLPDVINGGSVLNDSLYGLHYLQYLFDTYSSGGGAVDISGTLPSEFRLQSLQNASKQLIDSRDGIRWCVSDLLNNGNDPFITAECGATMAQLEAAIDSTSPADGGGTPLAESYHEMTEYFRGIGGYNSPVQYRCQKNFAVVVTDGYPTNDIGVPGDIPNETRASFGLTGGGSLPNWDGLAPATTVADFNNNTIPQYSDGFQGAPNVAQNFEGFTLYLDDLALFGNEIDLFRSGNDDAGEPFLDATATLPANTPRPDFEHQNIITHTIGFGIDNQMLDDTAEYGQGASYSATNAVELRDALSAILADVTGLVGSSAASTATTAFLSSGNQIFQVKYDTNDWTGSLLSYSIDSDPTSPTFGEIGLPIWTTDDNFRIENGLVPPRDILTTNFDTDSPTEMVWGNLASVQQAFFENDQDLFDYVLGDDSQESINGGARRNRSKLLGDVVHSQPVYVKDLDYGYQLPSYQTFLESSLVQNRAPVVYIGANDGFMHGFNATTSPTLGGSEVFAFMPQASYPLVADLDERNYVHHYFVDGQTVAVDAQFRGNANDEWGTVLVSSMGAGARSIFALDVTDPSLYGDISGNADDIYLWEISGSQAGNVALDATATQSSTGYGGVPSRAIDGNTSGVYNQGSVTHTNNENHPWLDLALAEQTVVDEIKLFNRTDCCSNRLSNFSVFVSDNPFASTDLAATKAQAGVTEYYFSGTAPTELTINVPNLATQYVRVQLNGFNRLSIAELEVYGSTSNDYTDLGHTVERPSVIRVDDNGSDQWLVSTGNGAHSPDGNAVFYLIDLNDGTKNHEVVLDDTGDNGIVGHTAIDLDGNDFVDRIYLADLKGAIWRLDWNTLTGEFESFFTDGGGDPVPLFQNSETTTGAAQPVTAAIEVTRFPGDAGALMLHVGTGKYYDIEDAILQPSEPERSFYGIVDRGNPAGGAFTSLVKSDLVEQTITLGDITGNPVRTVSSNTVNYATSSGWFIDLPDDGERVIYEAIAIKDRILFTTIIPRTSGIIDPCVPAVTGWLMEVDAITGSSPETVTFDANVDGDFDAGDAIISNGETIQVAGIQPAGGTGAPLPPSIIRIEPGDGSQGLLKGIVSDSQANLREFIHLTPINRTSWRRLD